MSELNVGGSNMTVELREDTNTLHAEANTGNKQWLAVITDTHPKYNYEREFVAYQKPRTSNRDSGTATVEDGVVLERVRFTHSGKNRSDTFYQLVDGELHEIDEVDVVAALEGEIVPDVAPEPVTVEGDAEPAIVEVHECPECGQRCASEHGVAVHQGLAHSDDGDGESDEPGTDAAADDDRRVVADGGLEVRDHRDVQHSDALVRDYRTPPGERLYAYRDGEHHTVVSRGNEPGDHWERRVPAERTHVVPGQQLWTVPDNWEKRVTSKRENIAYALYYIPETDMWVRLSIPTNNWLGDAWYGVKAVGDLAVEPVGDLGSSYDVRQLADDYEEGHDEDGVAEDAEAIREIARGWDAVEEDLRLTTEWVRDEGLDEMQPGDQPIHADQGWQIEFHQDRVFRPGEVIERAVDLSEYEIPLSIILDELRNAGLLPDYYTFGLTIDESARGTDHDLQALAEAGCTPSEALDYLMTEIVGKSQTDWADARGKDRSTVSGNVSSARRKLTA